MTIKGNTK